MLRDLCIDIVVKHDLVYFDKVPEEIHDKIRRREVELTCNSTVTRMRKVEEEREPDNFLGFIEGIQGTVQNKIHVSINSHSNTMSYGSTYMLYYLKQNPGFQSRFNIKYRRGYKYDGVSNKDTLFVVYEM